jgi:hypothetical protein
MTAGLNHTIAEHIVDRRTGHRLGDEAVAELLHAERLAVGLSCGSAQDRVDLGTVIKLPMLPGHEPATPRSDAAASYEP